MYPEITVLSFTVSDELLLTCNPSLRLNDSLDSSMKLLQLLPLVAASSAFVIPDEQILKSLSLQDKKPSSKSLLDRLPSPEQAWEELDETFMKLIGCAKHKFDEVVDSTCDTAVHYGKNFEDAFAPESWLDSADPDLDLFDEEDRPPHHGPSRHGRPHHKSNLTVYQLIAESKYTTKLAELINKYDDLVELLNGTTANFTVFAPTDRAFEKIPKHAPEPSEEFLKKLLTYHVSSDFYPAGRVLVTRTIPTLLKAEFIGDEPQRLSTQISFKGLTVNFYSRIVAVDVFGTNGVIHGVDSILVPPPKVRDIVTLLPGEFSTLELGLRKTGLYDIINDTDTHVGGTLFAPSNFAFRKLGPRANAFLFSSYGEKYLKAILLYHIVDNFTLYSDAYYNGEDAAIHHDHRIPKSRVHLELHTALEGKMLGVDVARYGRLITIKVNGFSRVVVQDGIAADGVIQLVSNVLVPPKTEGPGVAEEDISVEDLMARLEPYVEGEGYNLEL